MNRVIHHVQFPGGQVVEIVHGDLLREPVDAIVNAANSYLQHGGGVAGAISDAGGPQVQAESDAWVRTHGTVSHERPAYTSAGRLPFRYILHAVGPFGSDPERADKLAAAVRGSLETAEKLGLASLALPALSTGIFGYPLSEAARVIWQSVQEYFNERPASGLKQVRLTLIDGAAAALFAQVCT